MREVVEKKAFLMYCDNLKNIDFLSLKKKGELFTALLKYANGMEITEFSGEGVRACFNFISSQMERAFEMYDKKSHTNRENGKNGGRPKKESELIGDEIKNETVVDELNEEFDNLVTDFSDSSSSNNPNKPNETELNQNKPNNNINNNTNTSTNTNTNTSSSVDCVSGDLPCGDDEALHDGVVCDDDKASEAQKVNNDDECSPKDKEDFKEILLPLADGTDYVIDKDIFKCYSELYPDLNLRTVFLDMKCWLNTNKTRRKTRSDIERFINGWLSRNVSAKVRNEAASGNSSKGAELFDRDEILKQLEAMQNDGNGGRNTT